NRQGNKFLPFGPFISRVPADECLQISRILCPAAQGGAVSLRGIATPIHPRVRIFPTHLSIRRNIRALKWHCQRQPNIARSDNNYFHYLVSLSEGRVFLYPCRFRRKEEQPGI